MPYQFSNSNCKIDLFWQKKTLRICWSCQCCISHENCAGITTEDSVFPWIEFTEAGGRTLPPKKRSWTYELLDMLIKRLLPIVVNVFIASFLRLNNLLDVLVSHLRILTFWMQVAIFTYMLFVSYSFIPRALFDFDYPFVKGLWHSPLSFHHFVLTILDSLTLRAHNQKQKSSTTSLCWATTNSLGIALQQGKKKQY